MFYFDFKMLHCFIIPRSIFIVAKYRIQSGPTLAQILKTPNVLRK